VLRVYGTNWCPGGENWTNIGALCVGTGQNGADSGSGSQGLGFWGGEAGKVVAFWTELGCGAGKFWRGQAEACMAGDLSFNLEL